MRFLGLKTCDTCRKARKALSAAGYPLNVIDVRDDGLTAADVDAIVARFPEKAINRASTTWRGLTDAQKEQKPEVLLAQHPTLLKRPVIDPATEGEDWTIGWTKDVQQKWLPAAG